MEFIVKKIALVSVAVGIVVDTPTVLFAVLYFTNVFIAVWKIQGYGVGCFNLFWCSTYRATRLSFLVIFPLSAISYAAVGIIQSARAVKFVIAKFTFVAIAFPLSITPTICALAVCLTIAPFAFISITVIPVICSLAVPFTAPVSIT